jgi:maltose alpha-D-glucosyltransferase/alpha-amylase
VMGDAFADEPFCRAVLDSIRAGLELKTEHGRIRFRASPSFASVAGGSLDELPVSKPGAQSSNTIVTFGEQVFLKGYRRIRRGVNPEFEIGEYLTEFARFPNCVPVAGVVEYVGTDGVTMTLAMVQGYVANQGDGWTLATAYLQRHLESRRTAVEPEVADTHAAFLTMVATLGQRTAEMHLAFAMRSGNPAFEPEPLTATDLAAYRGKISNDARTALSVLEMRLPQLPVEAQADAKAVLASRDRILHLIEQATTGQVNALKTRYHGDYHLGQVLVTKNDFVIIDFEGEPGRSLEERRMKQSPLKDVAGMLRSFGYARLSSLKAALTIPEQGTDLPAAGERFEAQVRKTFLDAYDGAAKGAGLYDALTPGSGLLGLFELEKALYELQYELNNRPDWVRIPLTGILGIVGQPPVGAGAATQASGDLNGKS